MLEDWQKIIESYLVYFSDNIFVRAVVIVICSWLLALLLDRVIMTWTKKASALYCPRATH